MNLRNRILGLAGTWKLGVQLAPVLKMLPAARQAAVTAGVETLRSQPADKLAERLGQFRTRERRRIGRLGRKRFGAGWSRLDPRLLQSQLMKPR